MSLNIEQPSNEVQSPTKESQRQSQDNFSAVVERLKIQKAIPPNLFVANNSQDSLESQVKLLFQNLDDPSLLNVFKTVIGFSEENNDLMKKRISSSQIMNFAQVILYKVLPCPEKECLNCPRDVVIKNQYKDYEYECPFYHGEKDKRRLVMTSSINEEFIYKANYAGEKNNNTADKEKCSLNYFESMFHPLYYKMFRCKREYCNFSLCCPFFHSEDEKKAWDRTFSNYIRKDRIDYVKEKQRYLEGTNPYALNKVNTSAPQKKQPQEGPVRFFRSGAKPAETNDKESTCTSNETSSPLSGYSGFSSQKDDEKHHQKNLEEPIFAQPSQNDEGNGSGNGNGKGFKSNFFYKGKNWNRNQFQYVYVKSNENEIDTPSTGTSTDRKTNNYWRNSKKPMY